MVAYQSLYRRYRPQKFSEIKGQDHVVRALQTAVRTDKVGHAYLLHGPRGSGKTSTARVLAKALNCTDLGDDGEPCCVCESCLSILQGRSFDLQELDAASNNKVDDMRGLLERVNLTSPGRAKVYLLDEVHMLTAGAENALLKTLEEPPDHVTWVLATTEPHKVVHTIRSRCQVFELGLIGAEAMSDHLRHVAADAELDIEDEAIDHAVAAGGGSVRDSLTALERIVAGGGTTELDSTTDAILAALADHDRAAALSAVGDAVGRGRDPRTIGEMTLAGLRDAFLTAMGDPPTRMSEHERNRAADLAGRMAPAAITRALETLGRALIDMRQAPDPRIDIEVALMRLCHPDEDRSLEALAQRVRQLEARLEGSPPASASGSVSRSPAAPEASAAGSVSRSRARSPAAPEASAPEHPAPLPHEEAETPSPAAAPPPASAAGPAAAARRTLSETRSAVAGRRENTVAASPATAPGPVVTPPPVPAPDLASMRPTSPSEVVELAGRHLGLDRTFVVARAKGLEPDTARRREPAQLRALWRDLVAHASNAVPAGEVDRPPEAEAPQAFDGPRDTSRTRELLGSPEADAPPGLGRPSEADAPSVLDGSPEVQAPRELDAAPEAEAPPEVAAPPEEPETVDGFDLADLDDLAEAPSHAHDIEEKIKATFPGTELALLPEPDGDDAGGRR